MEIIEVSVEYPSGLEISDRGTYDADAHIVYGSVRLAEIMGKLSQSEPPATVSAAIGGVPVELEIRVDGNFSVPEHPPAATKRRGRLLGKLVYSGWTKEQRQQFGRFCHSLTVASLAGFVGYGHSTQIWTLWPVLNEVALAAIVVVTFFVGMDSMNGE
ncbi:hypothetical protein [Burkholderia vietnamiensis]|uniref:hypothetical protein n=1 Tax=Burkholderia vietnamiensis TaxID=60552 RepID=UPI00075506C1|nr:hypothetical protein [Burkholderia vietnamiensis]KVF67544.1 hypothetical protein WJ17_16345 [Burkholderia vietnamiensis]